MINMIGGHLWCSRNPLSRSHPTLFTFRYYRLPQIFFLTHIVLGSLGLLVCNSILTSSKQNKKMSLTDDAGWKTWILTSS